MREIVGLLGIALAAVVLHRIHGRQRRERADKFLRAN
jgi:hypothetical protein